MPAWRWSVMAFAVLLLGMTPLAAVEVQVPSASITGGSLNVPFGSTFSQCRVQSIYLASEIGTSGRIRSLTMNFTSLPGKTLNNCTIRLKHTPLSSYASATWETGFTQVFQGNVTVGATGNYTFIFTTPFNYDSANNLMVDVSFRNASIDTVSGNISYTSVGSNRSIYYRDATVAVNPLTWSGATPSGIFGTWVPNVYLGISSRLYVRPSAFGRGNGIDWNNAMDSVSTALTNSASGDEIWVALGTYKPGAARANTFQLKSGVALYGGFNGSETLTSERTTTNRTVLSGDIGAIGNNSDNNYSVITGSSVGSVTIDGFVIRDGAGSTFGGGLNLTNVSGTINNCVVTQNSSTYGAGIWNSNGNLAVSSCFFIGNTATSHGGGVFNSSGFGGIFDNCVFANNATQGGSFGGAGVFNESLSAGFTSYRNCTFFGNTSAAAGGAAYNYGGGAPSFQHCILWSNTASPNSTNQIANLNGGTSSASYSIIQGGVPTGTTNSGGNLNQDPQFFAAGDLDGADNLLGTSDDGLALMSASPAIDLYGGSGALASDIAGRPRNVGNGYDSGAYETPGRIYVSAMATGAGNGTSWENAYTQLSAALAAAPEGPQEIWVRAGTYKPTSGSDRSASFVLRPGHVLYGGFSGVESNRDQRDWRTRTTILSGDIGAVGTATDNSYHVVTMSGVTTVSTTILDGFIIRDAYANGGSPSDRGGGIYATSAFTLANCALVANVATYGGGLFNNGTALTATNVFFLNNSAQGGYGGGVFNAGASATYTNCLFSNNASTSGSFGGGGLYNVSGGTPVVQNCTFANNSAVAGGGGMANISTTPILRNNLFTLNTSGVGGAGNLFNSGVTPAAVNCLFDGPLPSGTSNVGGSTLINTNPLLVDINDPLGRDGILGTGDDGLNLTPNSPARNTGTATGVTTSDIAGNVRTIGSSPDIGAYERLAVLYVDIEGPGGGDWGSAYDRLDDALNDSVSGVHEIWVADGVYTLGGGRDESFYLKDRVAVYGGFAGNETNIAARAPWSYPTELSGSGNNAYHVVRGASRAFLDGVTISGGSADDDTYFDTAIGGGLYDPPNSSTTAINCIFRRNYAFYYGGAILSDSAATTQVRGCLFIENEAGYYAGGMMTLTSSATIINCTFVNNRSSSVGGSLFANYLSPVTITNTIMWGNSQPEIYNGTSTIWIANSTIAGSGGSGGSWNGNYGTDLGGNLDSDPQFLKESDPYGGDGIIGNDDDGLRLNSSSVCINAGIPAGGPRVDLLGNARPSGNAPDHGCYEGRVTYVEFALGSSSGSEAVTNPLIEVRLATASDLPVTVTYARATGGSSGTAGSSDFDLDTTTLVFAPGETSKYLDLDIENDSIQEADETIGFVFTGVTNARISGTTYHLYTILNNDTAGITTSPTTVSVTEGGANGQFTLSLNTTPDNNAVVTVVVTSTVPGEARLTHGAQSNQSSVTVTWDNGANGYGSKTVTVVPQDESIDDGDVAFTITTAPATCALDSFYAGKDAADVSVTTIDNDTVGIVLSTTSVTVAEDLTGAAGTSATTGVSLASQPTSSVTINVSSSNTADATVSPATLTFTTANWSTVQNVTITAANDSVDEIDSPLGSNSVAFTVTLDASSSDLKYDPLARTVNGTMTDNDTAGVSVTPVLAQNVAENGGTVVYSVVLNSQPTAPVTIGSGATLINSSNTAEGTVSPTTLTFGTGTGAGGWNTAQLVTVIAVNDDLDAANPSYTITFPVPTTADTKYSAISAITRTVTNTDDDTAAIVFTPNSGLITNENGGTSTTTVTLASQPTGNVTLTIASSDTSEGLVRVGLGAPAASVQVVLTTVTGEAQVGTQAGWNVGIPITIVGQNDSVGVNQAAVTYYLSTTAITSTDGNYSASLLNAQAAQVVNEDDVQAGVAISPVSLSINENGGTGVFSVQLNTPPGGAETVTVSLSSTAADALIDDAENGADSPGTSLSLTFTSANYSTPRLVTVTGVDDSTDNPGNVRATTIVTTSTSTDNLSDYDGITVSDVSVTLLDDDTRGVLVVPDTGLTTTETGGQAIFTVLLTSRPTAGTVTVNLATSDATEGRVRLGVAGATSTTLGVNFTSANWNVPQVVSIVGQDDAIADGSQAYTIDFTSVTATAGDYNATPPSVPASVSVNNSDNDTAGVSLSTTALTINEQAPGNSGTYTVQLTSQPTDDVVITLNPGTYATVDTDTGTALNQVEITFTASGNPTATTYAGGVRANWNVPLTITVTAVDDEVADGNHDAVIKHAAASDDTVYDNIIIAPVTAQITDEDVADITPSATSGLTTIETAGGSTAVLTYVLDTRPRANVTLLLTSSDTGEAVPVPDRLTFTPDNYNVPSAHEVQVRGVDDSLDDGSQPFTISGILVSADTAYDGLSVPNVTGSNQDDDVAGVAFTVTTLGSPLVTTENGGSVSFLVRLTAQPTADVTIQVTSNNTAEGTVTSAAPLTFTATDWNVSQVVTVTGEHDFVDESPGPSFANTAYTVTVGPASGPGSGYTGAVEYNGVTAASGTIYFANTDIDSAGVVVTPTSGLVTSEAGTTASYTVVLASRPSDDVTVNIVPQTAVLVTGQAAVAQLLAPLSVVFTTTDWDEPQTVIVTAIDDDVAEGDSSGTPHAGVINHTVTSNDTAYDALVVSSVNAVITDNDTPGLDIAAVTSPYATEDPLDSQPAAVFSVGLTSQPTDPVVVEFTSPDPGEILLSTTGLRADALATVSLTIQPGDWNSLTPQTITAFGVDDDLDDGDQAVSIQISINETLTDDVRYDGVEVTTYQVTNRDDDVANVTITESPHGVGPVVGSDLSENVVATPYLYTVVLDSEPTGDVTITVSAGADVTVDTDNDTVGLQTTLVFSAVTGQAAVGNTAGWNVPLTVRVYPVDDLDAEGTPHDGTITHSASGGGYTGVSIASVIVQIADNDLSDPPVVTLPSANPFAYDETGHLARPFDTAATVDDLDSFDFDGGSVTVEITAGLVATEDILGVRSQGTGLGQISVAVDVISYTPLDNSGTVTIGTFTGGTGTEPLAISLTATTATDVSDEAVTALLRNLTYRNSSLNPDPDPRTLTVTMNDGDGGTSAPVTKTITITPFDDPPTIAPQTIVTAVSQTITGQLVAVDPEGDPVTFDLVVGSEPLNGDLTLNADGTYEYEPFAGDFATTYTFQVTVSDASLNTTAPVTITIEITGGDEPRPQLLNAPPMESQLGADFATLIFDPASKGGSSEMIYRVVGLPDSMGDPTITVEVTSTSANTAQIDWEIQGAGATIGQHFTFGIIVIDVDAGAATYVPVTIQLISPAGPG